MNSRILSAFATASLLVTACDRQPAVVMETTPRPYAPTSLARIETLETQVLRTDIDKYEHSPSAVREARVKKVFAEIELEFAELNELLAMKSEDERANAAGKLAALRACLDAEQIRFLRLEALSASKAREHAEQLAEKGAAERIGGKMDDAARKVGNAFRDAGETIRERTR